MGTIICFGAWFQIGLGIVNHIIFRKYGRAKGAQRPLQNTIHVWLGRILAMLALVNIPLGMHMHHSGVQWYIGYTVWVAFLCVVLLGLIWKITRANKAQEQQQEQQRQQQNEQMEERVMTTVVEQKASVQS